MTVKRDFRNLGYLLKWLGFGSIKTIMKIAQNMAVSPVREKEFLLNSLLNYRWSGFMREKNTS